MNEIASEIVARSVAGEFEPDELDPGCRAIYDSWARGSDENRAWVDDLFGMMRVVIFSRRRAGRSERKIRTEVLGLAHDHADAMSLPENRPTSSPRHENLAMMRAIFEQALRFRDDDFGWAELLGDEAREDPAETERSC